MYNWCMPRRNPPLVQNEIYHIFNRGVEKRNIFSGEGGYKHFLETLEHYRVKTPVKHSKKTLLKARGAVGLPEVEILCYCLMPNHFHLLLRQISNNGTATFIGRIANSYTKYFNTKYERVGPLFQGTFKAVRIETDDQLLHVSRYIHLNPLVSGLVDSLKKYLWSSHPEYINEVQNEGSQLKINTEKILSYFHSKKNYENFVLNQADYGRSLEELKYHKLD